MNTDRPINDDPRVLIVDDDHAAATSVAALMTAIGVSSQIFPSAEAFLESADQIEAGCLILDIRLSGMSGLDLRKEMLKRGVEIPTILISGHMDSDSYQMADRDDVIACLEKPYSAEQICNLVSQALASDH